MTFQFFLAQARSSYEDSEYNELFGKLYEYGSEYRNVAISVKTAHIRAMGSECDKVLVNVSKQTDLLHTVLIITYKNDRNPCE